MSVKKQFINKQNNACAMMMERISFTDTQQQSPAKMNHISLFANLPPTNNHQLAHGANRGDSIY